MQALINIQGTNKKTGTSVKSSTSKQGNRTKVLDLPAANFTNKKPQGSLHQHATIEQARKCCESCRIIYQTAASLT